MIAPVDDPRVWRNVRTLYVGSAFIFVGTILIGIDNVFTPGAIDRGQILAHFHSGTIGWVTLSVIATTIWVYTGSRVVSKGHALLTSVLAWGGLLAVVGYVASFWLTFGGHVGIAMLPVFGIPAAAVIWAAFVFAATNVRRVRLVTTVHLLLLAALLVASLGATMGVFVGLSYAGVVNVFPASSDVVGSHAAPMDMYLALAFAAIAELLFTKGQGERWTRLGMTQGVLGVVGAVIVLLALYAGAVEPTPIGLLAYVASVVIYMVRIGWRAFRLNPFVGRRNPAAFFGGFFLPFYVAMYVFFVVAFFIPDRPIPPALNTIFVHITFVGMATNLLLATHSYFGKSGTAYRRLEPAGAWIMNAGLVVFALGLAFSGSRHGALVMALGAGLALFSTISRLIAAKPRGAVAAAPPDA